MRLWLEIIAMNDMRSHQLSGQTKFWINHCPNKTFSQWYKHVNKIHIAPLVFTNNGLINQDDVAKLDWIFINNILRIKILKMTQFL